MFVVCCRYCSQQSCLFFWRLAFAVCCSALAALANVVRFVVVIGSISVGGFMLHTNIFAIKNGAAAVTPIRTQSKLQQQQQQQRQICLANRILYACSFELDFCLDRSSGDCGGGMTKVTGHGPLARGRCGGGVKYNPLTKCSCTVRLCVRTSLEKQQRQPDCSYNNVGCLKYIKILIFALEVSCIGASVCVGVLASVLEN